MRNIIETISDWLAQIKLSYDNHKTKEVQQRARDLFDITIFENKQWVTYNGNKVCPCDMLEEKNVAAAIETMRWNYIFRHTAKK